MPTTRKFFRGPLGIGSSVSKRGFSFCNSLANLQSSRSSQFLGCFQVWDRGELCFFQLIRGTPQLIDLRFPSLCPAEVFGLSAFPYYSAEIISQGSSRAKFHKNVHLLSSFVNMSVIAFHNVVKGTWEVLQNCKLSLCFCHICKCLKVYSFESHFNSTGVVVFHYITWTATTQTRQRSGGCFFYNACVPFRFRGSITRCKSC